mmetsp:Transcript_19629/g.61672  ORF Transcript_19629/g.61672 Transcript_19629/m.61672 type:complete len:142 (+) Transcript_19629:442-867(+)
MLPLGAASGSPPPPKKRCCTNVPRAGRHLRRACAPAAAAAAAAPAHSAHEASTVAVVFGDSTPDDAPAVAAAPAAGAAVARPVAPRCGAKVWPGPHHTAATARAPTAAIGRESAQGGRRRPVPAIGKGPERALQTLVGKAT